jgi:hypothetical protein
MRHAFTRVRVVFGNGQWGVGVWGVGVGVCWEWECGWESL